MTTKRAKAATAYIERYGWRLCRMSAGTKAPTYRDWGDGIGDVDEARAWWTDHPEDNLGVVLGPSGVASLDIDDVAAWETIVDEYGLADEWAALQEAPTVQGNPARMRIMLRVPEGVDLGYHALQWPAREGGGRFTVCELRAATDGHARQDVLPPSIHPETGKAYKWAVKPPRRWEDWPEVPAWLVAVWTDWDAFKPQFESVCPWSRDDVPAPVKAARPRTPRDGGDDARATIDAYCDAHPIEGELARCGYVRKGRRWLSPYSSTGLPGVIVRPDGRGVWIHHASDPLCGQADAFDLMRVYDHGGSWAAAFADARRFSMADRARSAPVLDGRPPHVGPPDPPPIEDEDLQLLGSAEQFENAATSAPFTALGFDEGRYYYLPAATEQVCSIGAGSHTQAGQLLQLADLAWWCDAYPRDPERPWKGPNWTVAAGACMAMCKRAGVYDARNLRGRGVWVDGGVPVLHAGDRLVVGGVETPIAEHETRYVYQRQAAMRSSVAAPMERERSAAIAGAIAQLRWEQPDHAKLFAGWVALSTVCGALDWRPHVWLTAARGAGKSWVLENVVRPLVGEYAIVAQGSSTEAGIRQQLGVAALPVVIDEAEAHGTTGESRVRRIIELARQASSGDAAPVIKGTATGDGVSYSMHTMFLFASIGVALTNAADETRWSVVRLRPPVAGDEAFAALRETVAQTVTRASGDAFRARMYSMVPTIRANAETLARAVSERMSRRMGDQLGALLAGWLAMVMDERIDDDYARRVVDQMDLTEAQEAEAARDEEMLWGHLMAARVRVDRDRGGAAEFSLYELVDACNGGRLDDVDPRDLRRTLHGYGVRVEGGRVYVANAHSQLARLMSGSPWAAGWSRVLERLDGAERCPPMKFLGVTSRAVSVPLDRSAGEVDEQSDDVPF